MPQWEAQEWATILAAISAAIGAIVAAVVSLVRAGAEAAKTRAEVAAMRAELAKDRENASVTAALVVESHHQLTPNNGGSVMDATSRLEATMAELQRGQDDLRQGLARVEDAHSATAADVRGMRRDLGRLADADQHLSKRGDQEHDRLHGRIDDVERVVNDLVDPHTD